MIREHAGHTDTKRLEPYNDLMNGPRVPSVVLLQRQHYCVCLCLDIMSQSF